MNDEAKELISKIENYDFNCMAGNIKNCKEFIELKKLINNSIIMRKDNFNTEENILWLMEQNNIRDKYNKLLGRGIKLTPLQANLYFFGGRGYGKTFLSLLKGAEAMVKLGSKTKSKFYISHAGKYDRDYDFSEHIKEEFFSQFIEFINVYYKEINIVSVNRRDKYIEYIIKDKENE